MGAVWHRLWMVVVLQPNHVFDVWVRCSADRNVVGGGNRPGGVNELEDVRGRRAFIVKWREVLGMRTARLARHIVG